MHKIFSPLNKILTSLLAAMAVLCIAIPAHAAYIKRFATIDTGAMTFTGNTLGLDKTAGQNNPGTAGSIGAFIDTNTTSQVGSYPAGTTLTWSQNSSSAQLSIPAGSTILYAELIWGGDYISTDSTPQDVSAYLNNSITMNTPFGSYPISPDGATAKTCGDSTHYFYVRSADVTAYVQSAGNGTYTVGGVPATVDPNEDSNNCAGWTLAVVYRNTTLPIRSMAFFVGCEFTAPTGGSTATAVSGFCVNNLGTINARLMVSAMEGDIAITGDQMLFGPAGSMQAVSGPNNPVNNFFGSQINGDTGVLNTSGTFGGTNPPASGGRQGWDITNVDVSGILQHGQTTASAQGTTNGDGYAISSIGIQVDAGAPAFPTSVMSVDKSTTSVGNTLTYTTRLDNTTGTADAQSVVYKSLPPPDTSFISGSVKTSTDGVNYISVPGADPTAGFNIGNVVVGAQLWVQYQVIVNAVPLSPAAASYVTNSSWTYNFLSACPGVPRLQATTSSNNTTATLIDRLDVSKSASVSSAGGTSTITWTITVANTGLTNTSGSWLTDAVPAGTTYAAGSTTMNGAAVADVGGQMPFASGGLIHGPGRTAGVVDSGDTVTVVFKSTCPTTSLPKTNMATIYPNGTSGTDPSVQAGASTSPINADLGVTVTDGATTKVPGTSDTYTVTVTNSAGSATVTSLTLSVPLPAAVLSPSYTASTGAYNPATGSWTGLNLTGGSSITLTITGTIDPTATGLLAVTATVVVPPGITDPNSANNTATDTDTLTPQVDLSITNTDGQTTAQPGSQVTYTITVTNNGPSAVSSFWVRDTVPANLQNPVYTPNMGTYNVTSQYWTDVNLASGQSAVLTVQGTVLAGTPTLVYSATVSTPYNTTDPNLANNTASDTDTVLNLSATETVSPSSVRAGGTVTYTVTLTSVSSTATTVTSVSDALPSGFTYKTGTTTGLTTTNPTGSTGTITWNGSWPLPANGNLTLTFQATASSTPGTYNSTATYTDTPYPVTSTGPAAPVTVYDQGMSMTASTSAAIAGGTVSYTATLTNYLPSSVTVTSVSDTLPSGFTYTGATSGMTTANPTGTTGTVTWSGSWTLPANSTLTLTFSATTGTTDGTYTSNASFTTSGYPNVSTGPTAPVQVFHLNIAKTASQPNVNAGGTASYTVTITNTGPNSVPVTQVADTLPAGFTYVAGTTTGMTTNNPTVAGQVLTWTGGWTLPANGTLTLTFHAAVSSSETDGTYYNNVSFTPTGYPVRSSGNTAPVAVFQLSITKTAVQDEVVNNGTVNYTITMTSTSASPVTVTSVVDTLPSTGGANFTYITGSSSGMTMNNPTTAGHTYTWSGNWTIPANGSLTLNFNATAAGTNGSTYYNNASFTTAYGTLSTGNTADVTIATYDVTENVNTAYSLPGGKVTYTITMTNTSNSNRTVTSVSDTLPTGFTYVSGSSSGMTASNPTGTTGTITWSGTYTIARNGGTLTLTFSATASSTPGTYTSNATWVITGQTTYPTGPTAPVTVVNMTISKTVNVSQSLESVPVTYTITVVGPPTFSLTSITDTLPTGFTYVTGSTAGLTNSDPTGTGPITWSGSWTLPSNGTATLNFQAMTPNTRGTFTNTATVSGTGFGPFSTGNTASLQIVSPVMNLSKSADKTSAKPGDTVTYTLTYNNTGDAPAYTVVFLDNIPTYTTYVTSSTQGTGSAIQWSHDGGGTWNSSDAAPVTGITWTLSPLAPNAGGTLSFKVTVN